MDVKNKKRNHSEDPKPNNRQEVREFLGSAELCRLWIPGFAEFAWPLYEAMRWGKDFPHWILQMEKANS